MHAINQDKQLFVGGAVRMTHGDFENLYNMARAEAAYFDAWIGRLISHMQRLGLLDNTAIVWLNELGHITGPDQNPHGRSKCGGMILGGMGGTFDVGKVVDLGGKAYANLLLTLLNRANVPTTTLGNITGLLQEI